MAVHRLSRILPYAPEQLFDLVGEVRAYPQFVPWITAMRVWNEHEPEAGISVCDAEAQVGFSFLTERFATRVRRDRPARRIEVSLIRGPFRRLTNRWEFHPHPHGTRLEFFIDFEFRSKLLDMMLHANFDRAVSRLIACFEDRARALYGQAA